MRRFIPLAVTLIVALARFASAQQPSRALVYCPVGIDRTGCDAIVTALGGSFATIDRGYDGAAGTVDLATADINHYAVFIVPSLADGATAEPYALLRSSAVASQLKSVITGRAAIWAGTPDQGESSRDAKNTLLLNLATWSADPARPGLVVLQDHSADVTARYAWVSGISPAAVVADPGLDFYGSVEALEPNGPAILGSGQQQLAYDNMASFGLHLAPNAAGMLLGALGGTGNKQVVLATYQGGTTGVATIQTDMSEYTAGTPVRIAGSGWDAGETVRIALHEDPRIHPNRVLTATADATGSFVNADFIPEQHDGSVAFLVTASGETSRRVAQVSFTSVTPRGPIEFYLQAHQDDWQLFFGDRVAASVATASKVVLVYTTAGDAGGAPDYWNLREAAAKASVDAIAAAGSWACGPTPVGAHTILRCTKANTVSYFLRLPDGNGEGQGYQNRGSLAQLRGMDRDIVALDGSATYVSWADIVSTIQVLIAAEAAGQADATTVVHSQDWEVRGNGGDHSDHLATGDLTRAAGWGHPWSLSWYMGYPIVDQPINITAAQQAVKWTTIVAYDNVVKGNFGTILGPRAEAWSWRTIFRSQPSTSDWGPAAPLAGFMATPVDGSRIDLSWTDAGNEDGYRVERAPDLGGFAGQYSVNATLPANVTSWPSTDLRESTPYWYRVRAYKGEMSWAYSPEVRGMTLGTCIAPTFSLHPASQTVTAGHGVTFTALASGTPPPSYEWRRNGVTIQGARSATYALDVATGDDEGVYDVVASNSCGSVPSSGAQLTVDKIPAIVSLSNLAHAYDGSEKEASFTTNPAELNVVLSYVSAATGAPVAAPVEAGSYTVTATVMDAAYGGTSTGTLTIAQATPTMAWEMPAAITYGTPLDEAQLAASAAGIGGGSIVGTFTYSPAAGAILPAGTHSLHATFAPVDNVNFTSATAAVSLEVRKATPVFAQLASRTTTYGATFVTVTGRLAAGTGVPTGSVSISLGTGGSQQTRIAPLQPDGRFATAFNAATLPASPAPYPIVYSYAGDANYEGAIDNSTSLTVNKAVALLVLSATTHSYDGTVKAAVATTDPAGLAGVTLSYRQGSAAVSPRDAGTYAVEATLDNPNYQLLGGPVTGTLVISKAQLQIAAGNSTRQYGDPNPVLGGSVSGVVAGDGISASFATPATLASPVGSYQITATVLDPNGRLGNYDVIATDGSLSVTKAPVTLTAGSHEKRYGTAFAGFTGTVAGAKNGDVITISYESDGSAAGAAVGRYPITASPAGAGATLQNYAFTSVAGTLMVTPAALSITAIDHAKQYDGQPFTAFDVRYDGFVPGQGPSALEGTLSFTGSASGARSVGSYAIVPAGVHSGNYDISFVGGALAITPAPLSIAVGSVAREYGDGNPVFTGTITGAVAGDGISATYASAAVSGSPVGSYPIIATPADPQGRLGNYVVSISNGTLAISKAALSVRPASAARVYGVANPTFTGELQGLKNGDAITATYATTATASSPIGSYDITATLVDAPSPKLGNYAVTQLTGTLTIGKAALTVAANAKSRVYGAANPMLDGTVVGLISGDLDRVTIAYQTTATQASSVGSYQITPSVTGNAGALANYAITTTPATLTVTPAALTITAAPSTKVYGAALPAFEATYQGFVAGDGAGSLGGTLAFITTATAGSSVGSYQVTPSGLTAANYTISFVGGTLTVLKAPLIVAANSASREYGVANPVFTGTLGGVVAGDAITASFNSAATENSVIGAYPIVPALTDPNGRLGNYSITSTNGTLAVGGATLTVSANNAVKVYGQAITDFTGSLTGVRNGDVITARFESVGGPAASAVGSYQITPSLDGDPALLRNYIVTAAPGTLTVNEAPLTVTAGDVTRKYGEENLEFGASYSGFVLGETEGNLDGTLQFQTAATRESDVGVYSITPFGLTAKNYAITFVPGNLTVNRVRLTIGANSQTKTYDGTPFSSFTASYSGFVLGQDPTVLGGTLTFASGSLVNAGSSTVIPRGLTSVNYQITFQSGHLTISRAPASVTAADASREYGSANPELTGVVSGLLASDGISVSYASSAPPDSPAGSYQIVPLLSDPNHKLANYLMTTTKGTLTVKQAPLTVRANDAARVYGAGNPAFSASYSGFVLGQTEADLGGALQFETVATATTNVGVYSVTPAGLTSANYAITFAPGNITVNRATLTVAANNQTKGYDGQPFPAFTVSYSGFVLGQGPDVLGGTLGFTGPGAGATNAGAYIFAPAGLTSMNYDIGYSAGTLQINKAPLRVTAADATREYGAPNPSFTGSVTGLVAGDGIVATYSSSADQRSAVGVYPIVPSIDDPRGRAANYDVSLVNGALRVTAAPLTITPANATKVYGQEAPTFTGSIAGIRNGDAISASYASAGAPVASAAGSYPITASVQGAVGNYTVTSSTGTLSVMPAPLTVRANDATRMAGVMNPAFTATFTGFVGGESQAVLGGVLSFATPATQASPAGEYAIMPGGVTSSNYGITFAPGKLVVTAATLTISWTPADLTIPTGLGAAQLNAVAYGADGRTVVTGTYAYSSSGTTVTTNTVLQPGLNTPLTVVFTPTGADAAVYQSATKTVSFNVLNKIDITPGSTSNAISISGTQKEVMVGVLSTPDFDARTLLISGTTPTLGNGSGVETPLAKNTNGTPKTALTDLNADGRWDVMLYFLKAPLVSSGDVATGVTQLVLLGQLSNGRQIKGVDKISVIP